jgi:hypothetical protein
MLILEEGELMQELQQLISTIVYWIVVPIIMFALFVFATNIVSRTPNREAKTSAKAGLWAGLIIFIVFVISQMGSLNSTTFINVGLVDVNFWSVILGTIIGFCLLLGVRFLLPTRQVGFIVLVLAATSTSSLYSYIFIASVRNFALSITLGVGLGALFHIIILPTSVKDLF